MRRFQERGWTLTAIVTAAALVTGACGTAAPSASAGAEATASVAASQEGTESTAAGTGITMQMWGRSVDQKVYEAVVGEWNATHDNQIELTLIPPAEYIARVAAAAAGGALPDLLDVDLIYMPDFIDQGLLQPITEQVNAYPKKADLSPGHVQVSTTNDGKIYGVPFYVDASSLFWNKDLYKRAGLDPEKGPTTWAEVAEQAKKVDALGGDVNGFYFPGGGAGPR